MIYLASPYSHQDSAIREARYRIAEAATAILLQRGHTVMSPVVHSHWLHVNHGLGGDWDWWRKHDQAYLDAATELWILCIPGWATSKGVKAEIQYAREQGMVVRHVTMNDVCDMIAWDHPALDGLVDDYGTIADGVYAA